MLPTSKLPGIRNHQHDSQLPCSKVVIAVTGSVGAASYLPGFLLLSRRVFASEHRLLMTASAEQFVSPYSLHLFSGFPVLTDTFDRTEYSVPHIEVTRNADLLVVLPATANIMSKVANGIADDLVSTCIVAADRCPIVFVPNMNESMWKNKAVARNVDRLRADGHHIIEPTVGIEISTMEPTFGIMPDVRTLLKRLVEIVAEHRASSSSAG